MYSGYFFEHHLVVKWHFYLKWVVRFCMVSLLRMLKRAGGSLNQLQIFKLTMRTVSGTETREKVYYDKLKNNNI